MQCRPLASSRSTAEDAKEEERAGDDVESISRGDGAINGSLLSSDRWCNRSPSDRNILHRDSVLTKLLEIALVR